MTPFEVVVVLADMFSLSEAALANAPLEKPLVVLSFSRAPLAVSVTFSVLQPLASSEAQLALSEFQVVSLALLFKVPLVEVLSVVVLSALSHDWADRPLLLL
jgi:hypothetical protein